MKVISRTLSCVLSLAALALPGTARADDPAYKFEKPEDVKQVVWKALAQAGLIVTSGNSSTVTASGGLSISRNDGKNKLSLDAGGAYSQSQIRTVADLNGDGVIDQSEAQNRVTQTTAQNWLAKLRYDRFFTPRNSGYIDAFVGQDVVAAKSLLAGGQIGYSRLVVHSDRNELAAEIGYDFSYQRYTNEMTPPVTIHSARLFVGYVLLLNKQTAINASLEGLFNGNPIDVGPLGDPETHHGPFEAFRLNGKAGLSTVLYKNISVRFQFTARFDNAPAPLDLKLPKGVTLASGVLPRAEKLDTITEAALVVTFL